MRFSCYLVAVFANGTNASGSANYDDDVFVVVVADDVDDDFFTYGLIYRRKLTVNF